MHYLTRDDRHFATTLETQHDWEEDTYSVDESVPPDFFEPEDDDENDVLTR